MLFEVFDLHPVNFLLPVAALLLLLASLGIYQHPHLRGFSLLCLLFSVVALLDGFAETRLSLGSYLQLPVFALCLGPLLYLFMRNLVYGDRGFTLPHLGHFLPPAIAVMLLPFFLPAVQLSLVSVLMYGVLCARLLRKYHHAAFASHGDAASAKLYWSLPVVIGFCSVLVFELVNGQTLYGGNKDLTLSNVLMVVVMLFSIVYVLFHMHRQPLILTDLKDYFLIRDTAEVNIDKQFRQHSRQVFKQVEQLMHDKRPYQEPSFSLRDLATQTGIDPQQLTLAITQGFGGSFCDYINEYRVKALRKALQTAATTEDLWHTAMAQGFRTRGAVLDAIKRITGKDPKKYLNVHQG